MLISEFDNISEQDKIDYLRGIGNVSRNLNELLETVIEWSIIQKDNFKIEPKVVNLKSEVDKILDLFKIGALEKNIKLINKIDEEEFVNIDLNILHTIVRNFISNAIKFSKKDGQVTVNSRIKNGSLELSVEDTGVGMNQHELDRLFTNGFSKPTKGTNDELGSGLGLSICRELVDKMNGKIWAKSIKNKGSKFLVSVPIAD